MPRLKLCLLALAFCGAAGWAAAGEETWQLKSATGRLAFHPEVTRPLGVEVGPAVPDAAGHLVVTFEAAGRLELRAPGSLFRDVGDGELRLTSNAVLRLAGTEIPLEGLTVQRGPDERTLAVVGGGRVLFLADHMHFTVDREAGRIRMFNLDLRLAPEAARALGDDGLANIAVAVMEMEGSVAIPTGTLEQPQGGCVNPNYGLPDNDAAMVTIGDVQQMAKDPPSGPPVLIAVAPSATLKNVGVTDIPWHAKFSGNFPPYNNDQHPYLAWNMYRLSGGVLEQIGISPLKHAFLTINSDCDCPSGNIMWVGCADTYGTFNNDSLSDITNRPEVTAFTGVWQRCGSIFDPDCNGVENNPPPRATPMDRRMAVAVADLQTPASVYYIETWYIVRDDTNIFNTMGWRTVTPHVVTGGVWDFKPLGPMNLGPVVDQWVNPANPGPNAQSVPINTILGRLKLAVRAFDLGGGQWRYEYGLQNFDFDPRIKSFSVPLPPGVVATNAGFRDPDQDPANNWTATVTSSAITWLAPTEAAAQDYSSFYNFRFTANAMPTAAGGTLVTMTVQEMATRKIERRIIGPGGPTTAQRAEKR